MTSARTELSGLAEAVAWVSKAVPNRPTHPVLAGMKFTAASDGTLTVHAFNYETSHTSIVDAEVGEPGSILVSGHAANQIIGALRGGIVTLASDDAEIALTVSAGRSNYRLTAMALGEYPTPPEDPQAVGTVDAEDLTTLVKRSYWAAGREEKVAVLMGVHLLGTADGLLAEATNRFVMSQAVTAWDHKADADMLVPAAVLDKAVAGLHGRVEVGYHDGRFRLSTERRSVTTRCLDHDFPKIKSLIPPREGWTTTLRLDRLDFIEALKRTRVALEVNDPIWFELTPGATEMQLQLGSDNAVSGGDEYLDCTVSGQEIEVWFHPTYLIDALTSIPSELVDVGFTGNLRPAAIHPVADPSEVVAVVMPRKPVTSRRI